MSVRGDKPVTVSLQTEAQGAHLKQRDDWPTAIAGQHLHETGETGVVMVVGGGEAGRDASKTWHTFTGAEALCRPICDRARVIVLLPNEIHFVVSVEGKKQMIDGTK